jgi:AmmeMemoRadiSam system protein B/AmmeMemoRadiSam system protein A
MEAFSQNNPSDRQPVAAGRFYPANRQTLNEDLRQLFESCVKPAEKLSVRAIISPHAGYIFSGKIAAAAFSAIDPNAKFKNIFIIGSSHIMAFDGASVYNAGDFLTPLGRVTVNREIADKLKEENRLFRFPVTAHINEHSIEVQLPLLQYYFPDPPPIVPIIIGTNNTDNIKKIAEILRPWFNKDNLFIISSDFSHYPSYEAANEVDKATANGIISDDPQKFLDVLKQNAQKHYPGLVTSMCGWTSGLLLLYLAEGDNNLEFRKEAYCNSGDSSYGAKDEVVGYNAIVLTEKKDNGNKRLTEEISFTSEQKDALISLARENITSLLNNKRPVSIDNESMPEIFNKSLGAFVTLKINGNLRGCIGKFLSSEPLYEAVLESSASSALQDPRFSPLTKDELPSTDIEITVLGPLVKINDIRDIELGRHGIYIKKDFHSGTMLPQVATENGWTVEEFLGYTSRDKAGIGWYGWKNADLYVYEGIILKETKK